MNHPLAGKLYPCRLCGKPLHRSAMLQHAHSKHFVAWYNWRQSRIDFGLSLRDVIGLGQQVRQEE